MADNWKARTTCRACGSTDLHQYLDLGTQAPANALVPYTGTIGPEFMAPLSVSWCAACGLSQLDQVVDPRILYRNYPFRAGTSERWRAHCVELMNFVSPYQTRPSALLLDIGSNDGALLREADLRGWDVVGIDPDPQTDYPTIKALWGSGTAEASNLFRGRADVITATNVFGHVDDAEDFLRGIQIALDPEGVAVIECPHIFPLLEQTQFDTIYHEHLSYWSLRPLELVAERVGLRVVDVKMFPDLHGGTMRYTLQHDRKQSPKTGVTGLRILESAHFQQGLAPYCEFTVRVANRLMDLRAALAVERRAGRRIWAYGASAKGHVLLQAAGFSDATIERVVDDTEAKWGFLTPGTHIPITNANDLREPHVLLLLSWNNAPQLRANALQRGFLGRFVLPVPEPLVEAA